MLTNEVCNQHLLGVVSVRWQFPATIWHPSARRRARDDLDSINDWVHNLGHVPLGGQTHDRYNIDMFIAAYGDLYDDGGC